MEALDQAEGNYLKTPKTNGLSNEPSGTTLVVKFLSELASPTRT